MARTGLAERNQQAQSHLADEVAPIVALAWVKLVDRHDLSGSIPKLVVAIRAILQRYGRAAAAGSLTYYRLERRLHGVPGTVRLPMPALPSDAELTVKVRAALAPMYGAPSPEAETRALDALTSEVEQLVLDQGRHAVLGAAELDQEAKGWARVTKPGACYFCAMLATRGAVYHTFESANFRAHTKQPNGTGGDCRCTAEPVFNAYEPSAQVRQWMADWQRLKEAGGGKLSLIQWRRAYEGRAPAGQPGAGEPPLG